MSYNILRARVVAAVVVASAHPAQTASAVETLTLAHDGCTQE